MTTHYAKKEWYDAVLPMANTGYGICTDIVNLLSFENTNTQIKVTWTALSGKPSSLHEVKAGGPKVVVNSPNGEITPVEIDSNGPGKCTVQAWHYYNPPPED